MTKKFICSILIFLLLLSFASEIKSETEFDFFFNEFLNKRIEANNILKEIEYNLKSGRNKNTCSQQRRAAKLGLLANESLIKAYKIYGANPPIAEIEASKKRWNRILENC